MRLAILFNGTVAMGQKIGDSIVSVKCAWLMAQQYRPEQVLLGLSPSGELNFLWQKFIDQWKAEVFYDTLHPGNMPDRYDYWNQVRKDRQLGGKPFDVYKELYRRIDGGQRQSELCGKENGLGRRNIFEYMLAGQEEFLQTESVTKFESTLIYHPNVRVERDVLIAPVAHCQRNDVFTLDYWNDVVRRLVASGVTVTVAHNGDFCDDLLGSPFYDKFFGSYEHLRDQVCRHRLVCCGNTGVMWMAGACGVPLLVMQHDESHMQDYRCEWCGIQSLEEFLREPDVGHCVRRVLELTGHGSSDVPVIRKPVIDIEGVLREAAPLTPNPPHKLRLLADQLLSVEGVEGAVADVGTYRGGSALVLKKLCNGKELHCFDTWQGTPHDDPLCHHKKGEWKADIEECKRVVGEDAVYHEGVFPESIKSPNGDLIFSLVFIDVDTYQSTKDALEWFWPRMAEGGKMVVDDWNWEPCGGVQKAIEEVFTPDQINVYGLEHMAVVTK